ncbi:hypothetical protein GGQ95_002830 [Anoxybacillus rupiensis]|nr:hypothetical protein [Anoxybacillus rupiensis]
MLFRSETHKLFFLFDEAEGPKRTMPLFVIGDRGGDFAPFFSSPYGLAPSFIDDWCIFIGVLLAPCLCKTSLPAFYLYVLTRVSSLFHLKR